MVLSEKVGVKDMKSARIQEIFFRFTQMFVLITLGLTGSYSAKCKEGMWVPTMLKTREADMLREGLQIPTEMLYNETGTGLNNAVVLFGKGCTGEIISDKGLVLTNHHCGYGSAQRLSSPDKDYFAYGFWAMHNDEELPCPGLTVTIVRKLIDVTADVLGGIADTASDKLRDSIASKRILDLEAKYRKNYATDAMVKPYYQGNKYWMILSDTYSDIRLVGFPPNGIGAFGGDDENWVWPRHTGDFSMFRIYAGKDNKPAPYAKENKPFKADKFLEIKVSGYKKGDFTLVYGFPGTTNEYTYSGELKQVVEITDPIAIAARTAKLGVWQRHMTADRSIFLKYTSKYAGVANGWKKWQGEIKGLKDADAVGHKKDFENTFDAWAQQQTKNKVYMSLISRMEKATAPTDSIVYADQLQRETVTGIEIVQIAAIADKILGCMRTNLTDSAFTDTVKKIGDELAGFYKNYDAPTDKDVFAALMKMYFAASPTYVSPQIKDALQNAGGNVQAWGDKIYRTSVLPYTEKMATMLKSLRKSDSAWITGDPAWKIFIALQRATKSTIAPQLSEYAKEMKYLRRLYMEGQMEMAGDKTLYPDANLTLRVAYGKVGGIQAGKSKKQGIYQTTLGDVVALDDSTKASFKVPQKLKELYRSKDFGRWAEGGEVPVAFTASNHTTGGNSGSPVLDSRGRLIGLNFDRAFEGTMSDYWFSEKVCRNIAVDIRYVLFITERFGGCGRLIDEMKLIED